MIVGLEGEDDSVDEEGGGRGHEAKVVELLGGRVDGRVESGEIVGWGEREGVERFGGGRGGRGGGCDVFESDKGFDDPFDAAMSAGGSWNGGRRSSLEELLPSRDVSSVRGMGGERTHEFATSRRRLRRRVRDVDSRRVR